MLSAVSLRLISQSIAKGSHSTLPSPKWLPLGSPMTNYFARSDRYRIIFILLNLSAHSRPLAIPFLGIRDAFSLWSSYNLSRLSPVFLAGFLSSSEFSIPLELLRDVPSNSDVLLGNASTLTAAPRTTATPGSSLPYRPMGMCQRHLRPMCSKLNSLSLSLSPPPRASPTPMSPLS